MARFAQRLAALVRRHAVATAVFLVLLTVLEATRAWSIPGLSAGTIVRLFLGNEVLVNTLTVACAGLAALFIAAALPLASWRRTVAAIALTLAGVTIGVALLSWLRGGMLSSAVLDQQLLSQSAYALRSVWFYSAVVLMFGAWLASREREMAIAGAVREAELERARSQRALMESRLAVVQARVEPELLFAVLADVQRLYLRERTSGDRLLDDLIAYLRSALPEMRGGISTLGREIALMQTYLRILPAGRSGRLEASSYVAVRHADQAFPPMLLLMLAQAAAEAGARQVRVEDAVDSADDRYGIVVATDLAQPPTGWGPATLEPLRGVVRHWFGPDATLTVDCDATTSRASIVWSRATPMPRATG